jgi:VCBS repeat-containing protein
MTTLQNMPTTLNVLSNDACNNGPSCTLSNPTITDQPNNGTVIVNANGTLTYSPNSTFVGTDTIMYATCDNQSPSKCDTTYIIVSVNPTGAANTTSANEDYVNAKGNTPVSGNVLTNDTDPEGNTQTVATQNITNSQGTFVLNANGTYTFTAAAGYSGSVQYTYTVCDNGTPSACDTATIHILVLPPDVTVNLTITPNFMLGVSPLNVTVKVIFMEKQKRIG